MKTTLNKILMTASFLTLVAVATPSMANPSVLCSVRANYDAATGDANYKPGVDAQGKAVAPADVAAPAMNVPTNLRIPLSIDLAQRLNEVLPEGAKLEAQVGLVEVKQDGKVFINGKDLTGPTTAMCDNIEKQKAAAMKTKDAPKVKKPAVAKKPVEPVVASPVVDEPAMESAPVTPVEPQVLQTEPAPTPEPAPVVAPEAAAPAPVPAPETLLNPPASAPAFPGQETAPVAPAPDALAAPSGDAILSPTEGGMMPRPPVDPLAGAPMPTDPVPPAPAPMNNDANGGMLSGGAQ